MSTEMTEKALLAPYYYICQIPGKQVRAKLAQSFNFWLQVPDEKLTQITEIIQMLHNASLMIDDIEDNSILRRGQPVAHSIFGVARTINAANYAYFLALEKVQELGNDRAMTIFNKHLLELHRGQGMEIFWRDTMTCPPEKEYRKMILQKTGSLFRLAVDLMQLFSENKLQFDKLIDSLGLLFQIRDDYCNLTSLDYANQKTFAEDLTEGKFSFPIIYALSQGDDGDGEIINILRQRTNNFELKKHCVELLERSGSFSYTLKALQDLDDVIVTEINALGGNTHLSALMDLLRPAYSNDSVKSDK